jgi:polyisoprenoid-binding protein YceI
MKKTFNYLVLLIFCSSLTFAQGFKVKATGEQTFHFDDPRRRNQVSFFSSTPLEDITGLSNSVEGTVTFNVNDIKTLKGKISIPTESINTGIAMRDEHMKSAGWLNAQSFPEISFEIKKVSNIKSLADNKLTANADGTFTLHGVLKDVTTEVTLTYLDEDEQTKMRTPGDLLGVNSKFNIKLSDYGINNQIVGQKVSQNIEINVNIVGSNAK